jgi:hypothetical protein
VYEVREVEPVREVPKRAAAPPQKKARAWAMVRSSARGIRFG